MTGRMAICLACPACEIIPGKSFPSGSGLCSLFAIFRRPIAIREGGLGTGGDRSRLFIRFCSSERRLAVEPGKMFTEMIRASVANDFDRVEQVARSLTGTHIPHFHRFTATSGRHALAVRAVRPRPRHRCFQCCGRSVRSKHSRFSQCDHRRREDADHRG